MENLVGKEDQMLKMMIKETVANEDNKEHLFSKTLMNDERTADQTIVNNGFNGGEQPDDDLSNKNDDDENSRTTKYDNDVQMDELDNQLNDDQSNHLNIDDQQMENEENECMKRRIRLRNDLNNRKLRHLNKRREQNEQYMRTGDEDSGEEEEDGQHEEELTRKSDRISRQQTGEEQHNNNQSSNIVDLLTKNSGNAEDENDDNLNDEDSIKKYLGLQKLLQILQQQQQQSNQDEEENQENITAVSNQQSLDNNNQNDNQSINQQSDSSGKEWLLNAAAATFPLEKSQGEALAKQSPALLHQHLMMVQLLQHLQQQAVNESNQSANEDEKPMIEQDKTVSKTAKNDDEPMDCDQQTSSTINNFRKLFDLQKSASSIDSLNSKSKLNFGNLTPSSTTANIPTTTHQTASSSSSSKVGGTAPMPTRSAHTLNPTSTSSSASSALFTTTANSSSINSQLNRLGNNPLQNNSLNKKNPIDNLILMPDDPMVSQGEVPPAPTKNPLELLQFTAEKALQSTMKGASFLVNGDGENSENNSDDPANRHRCKFCEKVFGSDSAMQIHIRSHTGERPFKCNVCGNRFSTKGNLKVHFMRHVDKYPHVKMNANPIPEHMDKFFPPIEPPGSSQSPPPAQYQCEDDLLNAKNVGLNFAQGLAAAAAASQQTLTQQQKHRQQLQDINMLANLTADPLDSFSRELLLANSNSFLLKNAGSLTDKQLRELQSLSRSPAAAKLEGNELEDSSIQESALDGKQKKPNESIELLTGMSTDSTTLKTTVLNQLNQNIASTASSSASTLSQQQQQSTANHRSSISPIFGHLNNNNNCSTNKENDSSDELSNNYNMMLDYLLKAKQRKQPPSDMQNNVQHQNLSNSNELLSDKSNVNALLSELSQQQQQPFNPNLAAQAAAAQAISSLFSFLPPNLQLPYISQILHQLPFSAGQQHQPLNHSSNNVLSSSANNQQQQMENAASTVAKLLQSNSTNSTTAHASSQSPNNLDIKLESSNQTTANNPNNLMVKHHHPSSSPINTIQQQQHLLGTVLNNLNNSMTNRSTGRTNSPNSSLNSAHDFDLNSVLSSSPRNSPNIRQQLSQLAALTASSSTSSNPINPHQLISSPAHSLIANSTSSQTSGLNAYQDLLPKPGSTDNAWESLMEIEKDSEAAKIKKLVENCEQKITDPNQCVICQRILSCKSALQMHWRTHTGERPFKCKLCQRAFTTKGNLKTHMSVHRQKPTLRSLHECPVCHQQFTNALVLQQHVKQQHNQPDERQLIQAHQKAQQQLQYAAAMERIMMMTGAHPQKPGSESGLPANFPDESFFASLQHPNFNLSQLQAQLHNSLDRQSMDENSFEAAQNFLNGRLSEAFKQSLNDESGKQFDDDDFDDKDDMINDSKDNDDLDDITEDNEPDRDEDDLDDMMLNQQEQKQNENETSSERNSSPLNNSYQQQSHGISNSKQEIEQVHNMNEDSIASTISSSAGALDLTPKQQQAMAAHLQQLNSIMNSNGSSQSNSSTGNNQLLNIPNIPPFQLSARGANTTCRICMKTFACASALTIHYRSHSKERPFKCEVCERGFSTKGNMKQHLLCHKLRDFPPNSQFNFDLIVPKANRSSHKLRDLPNVLGPNVSGDNQLSSLMLNAAASVMNGQTNLTNNSLSADSNNHPSVDQSHNSNNKNSSDLNGLKEKLDLAGVINAVNGSSENCLLKSSSSSTSSSAGSISKSRQHMQQLNGDCQSDASCEANEADERRSLNGSLQFERSNNSSSLNSGNESSSSLLLNNNDLKRIGNLTNSITSNLTASLSTANGGASTSSTSNIQTSELKHMCEICVKPFSSHSALQIHNRTHTDNFVLHHIFRNKEINRKFFLKGDKPFKCNICGIHHQRQSKSSYGHAHGYSYVLFSK